MAVETVLSELADRFDDYRLIRDCIAGQRQIKKRRELYLLNPDPTEPDPIALKARYENYIGRAVFYGATGRTLRGLVGMVFDKDPAAEMPAGLEFIKADSNGGGLSLDQSASAALSDVVALGRAGVLTDYPHKAGPTTVAEAAAGNIRPTINRYKPEDIINWRFRSVGAKVMLCLVVIREQVVAEDDGFAETMETQYRVLRLDDANTYQVEIHKQDSTEAEKYQPQDGKGLPFGEIPFAFMGALDNSPAVDPPPLLDLAELNVAHYRNSADYEESAFIMGQPTPVLAGLTAKWVTEVLGGKVRFGSRGAIALPVGGSAELLQAQPNTLAFEAMTHKEDQMIALGAKLIENTGTVQTATEATQDSVMDNSVLGTAARNVSQAYRKALNWAWQFQSGVVVDDPDIIDYELNTDFAARMMSSVDRAEIIKEWQAKAITWEEMRWNLKRCGVAYEADQKAKDDIQSETETSIQMDAMAANTLGQATGQVDANGQPIPKPAPNVPPVKKGPPSAK